jgi:hypothetical protein
VRGVGRRAGTTDDVPGLLTRLIDSATSDRRTRAGILGRLTIALGASARRAGALAVASGQWLTDTMMEVAPHIPVRDYLTLRDHYGGLSGNDLARALIDNAARASGAVGAAGGVVSSLEFTAPPTLLTTPVQIAAETLAVVAIELKLVAELHEVYRRPAVGTPAVRTAAYLGAWTRRRGLDPLHPGQGLGGMITAGARRELRRRIIRRAGENAATVMPLLAGAVAGASLNSRETRRLGEAIAKDLGGRP